MMHGFGWGGGMWMGSIFWLLFLGVIVWAVISFTNNQKRNSTDGPPISGEETSLEILKRRYARGEISKEEFEQIKKEIL